ncbi:MAG TPA: TetR/AcrR family transcriptional regulator [Polyangiales bacterium]|jgi:AcrR family transcriptional regulator|nr:TetR/AcrR family transcriptional regulator [Polyangiales bacterium]
MAKRPAPVKKKRVRRSPEHARQHILESAVRTLSKHGPASCTLKDVAAEAGTSHALITHYFGTYEALVEAAVGEAMGQLRERLIARMMKLQKPTPDMLVQLYLDIALEPWYGRLVSWAFFNDRDATSTYVKQLMPQMKLIAAATEYVFSDNPGGAPTREQAEALLVSVWSMVVGYVAGNAFFWHALGRKPGPARDRAVRDVVGALARGLRLDGSP